MNKLFMGLGAVALLAASFFVFNTYIYNEKQGEGFPDDYRQVTFWISGEPVTLVNGSAEVVTELGGESKTTVRYFGNEVTHDIDGDGNDDVVFLITQETGGSGTFFYAVGALKREGGYQGTHAVYIGDRIAPQSTNAGEGRQVMVNYADRAPGESFAEKPSVGKTLYLLLDVDTLQFGEVVQNFEGEVAAPTALNLSFKNLTKVPSDVFQKTYLEELDVSHNQLSGSLPAEVRHLLKLKVLNLSNNKFTGVPAEVGQLKELEVLNLAHNQLTGLPQELGNLSNLKLLDVSGNNYSKDDLAFIRSQLPSTVVIVE